jgi:hypothetical protein
MNRTIDRCITYLPSAPLGSTSPVTASELHTVGTLTPQLLHFPNPTPQHSTFSQTPFAFSFTLQNQMMGNEFAHIANIT